MSIFDGLNVFAAPDTTSVRSVFYPQTINKAGPHFWATGHGVAARFPERPSKADRREMKFWLKWWIEGLPCGSCREHARQWVRRYPPKLRNNVTFTQWMEDFHNAVNRSRGKSGNYRVVLTNAECHSRKCSMMMGARDTPIEEEAEEEQEESKAMMSIDDVDTQAIEGPLQDMKQAGNEIISILCREAGIPEPSEVVHGPCPDMPGEKSCTKGVVGDNGKVTHTQMFFDPISASPRTFLHEFRHYFELVTGDLERFKDEHETERWARKVLGERFPYDEQPPQQAPSSNNTAAADTSLVVMDDNDYYFNNNDDQRPLGTSAYRQTYFRYTPRLSESMRPKPRESRKAQVQVSVEDSVNGMNKEAAGVMGMFDMIYPKELANIAGVSTATLSDAATPEILGYSINAVQDTIFSPLGSLLSSVALGTTLFGAGALAGPDQLAMRERRLVYETGSHFFFSWIRAVSPAQQQQLLAQAQQAGAALGRLDFNGFIGTLLRNGSTPPPVSVPAAAPAQQQAQAQQAAAAQIRPIPQAQQPVYSTRFAVGDDEGAADRSTSSAVGLYSGSSTSPGSTGFACNYE